MADPRAEQHGSRIIAALEHTWARDPIQDQHPDVPDVVIVTGPRREALWGARQFCR